MVRGGGGVLGIAWMLGALSEVIDYLKDPTRFITIGARIPREVLLVGPPGTGRALMARTVAARARPGANGGGGWRARPG